MSQISSAIICSAATAVVVPLGLAAFRTPFHAVDVILAGLAGGALSFVPSLGGPASLVATGLVLYWRLGKDHSTAIFASVAAARLAMIPAHLFLTQG